MKSKSAKYIIRMVSPDPDNDIKIEISGNRQSNVKAVAKTFSQLGSFIQSNMKRRNLINLLLTGKRNS